MTNKYGLLGKALSHSYSAKIHHLLGNSDYVQLAVNPSELDEILKSREFLGMNVTIPYKQTVIPYLDSLSESAKKIGSVNTILQKDGKLIGENTDYFGFLYCAKRAGIDFSGKKVLILGSGGTSLTAQAVTDNEGAREICVVSREGEINYDTLDRVSDYEIIINTTPVGMYPNNGQKLIDLALFPNCCGVMDAIYNPLYTELLLEAREKEIPHTNGLSMLVAQAVKAHELFFNTTLSEETIEDTIFKIEKDVVNIILIGMPGSGKTTIATMLAERTGRKMVDTDKMVEETAEMSIPDIFFEKGEAEFRKLEAEAIRACGKEQGLVISTGGGCVKSYENYKALKQNGEVYYLKRELDSLSIAGRPLSKDRKALSGLYLERKPLYEKYADQTVDSNQSIRDTLEELYKKFSLKGEQ